MDSEALAEARQNAQKAESRARLATDPQTKKRWRKEARKWRSFLTKRDAMEDGSPPRDPEPNYSKRRHRRRRGGGATGAIEAG